MRIHGLKVLSATITDVTTITAIVAAPGAGKGIVVLGYTLSCDGNAEIQWHSAAVVLSGAMEVTADTPVSGSGLVCEPNDALNLTSTGAACNGHVWYVIDEQAGGTA